MEDHTVWKGNTRKWVGAGRKDPFRSSVGVGGRYSLLGRPKEENREVELTRKKINEVTCPKGRGERPYSEGEGLLTSPVRTKLKPAKKGRTTAPRGQRN